MPIPWLQLIDAALGVANFARGRKAPPAADEPFQQLEAGARQPAGLEARLAGVVVAALKEAFDRDTRRLDLERQQLAAERERAERAMRLELQRQAVDREIARLRLLAAVAGIAWLGSLLLLSRVAGGSIAARVTLGFGWLLLLGSVASSFTAQASVAAAAETGPPPASGAGALWTMTGGLIFVAVAALLA